ncbi:uncharacterized protein ARMOST_07077 [Armillaria ostoyae]|uniref:Uncharacterized protein n=1 Tax=Armillaria ostoyae TaxID=47428 RepID=A0A284R4S6_ARMOS|nr:uncharacterized protein ARMOST_07077 [Armillaria ostoyae]
MSHSPPLVSSRRPKPGIIQSGRMAETQNHPTQLQAVQDARRPFGFTGNSGQPASQTSRAHKGAKVHDGIPTPSEDEEEEEEIAGSGQRFMSMEEYYAQVEQEEEDDDPDASIDLEDDHLPTLSHPPIATQCFAEEEEDELFSSPVAPQPLGNPNEGQNRDENALASSAQNPPNLRGASALQRSDSVFNDEAMASPHPIRFIRPGDSTLSILQMDASRDPDTPSPLPRQPPQGRAKIPPIDFAGRKSVERSQSVFEQANMQGPPLLSARPSSAGPPVQQLPSARPIKLGTVRSESSYYRAHSRPSSAASISHSTTRRASQEHPTDLGSTATFATSYPSLADQPIADRNVQPLLMGVAAHAPSSRMGGAWQTRELSSILSRPSSRTSTIPTTSFGRAIPPGEPTRRQYNLLNASTMVNGITQGLQGPSDEMGHALLFQRPSSAAHADTTRPVPQSGHSKSPSQPAVPMLQVTAPSPITSVATRNLDQLPFDTGVPSTPAGTYLHPSTAHDEASSIETSDSFEALPNDVPMDVPTRSGISDNASEVEDKPSPRSEDKAGSSEPHHAGRLQAESISRIEEAANQIWKVINETTKIDAAIQPSHIINCAFPSVVTHKMSHWNIFLAKYKADHPNEPWDQDQASLNYSNFKESFPNDEWKGILVEYAKVMDLDAGQRTRGKRQSVFKSTFQELAKQLEYHARRDGFEAIMAIVGANPKDDGPSMVAFHETSLAKGFADQKLHLKNDWAATHLRAYVQNRKSDNVVSLHRQRELQHEQEMMSPSGSDIPASVNGEAALLAYEELPMATTTIAKDAGKVRDAFTTYKLYRPDNAKSAHLSYTVNFSALLVYHDVPIHGREAPPITQDGYPDYRSCPWRRVGKSLQERNMILTGWPPMVPLPINDKMDPAYLSKSASSLTDSQRIRFAKALEDSEIQIAQVSTSHQDANAYVFVRTAIDIASNSYHEGVYCAETETSRSRTVKAVPKPAPTDSNRMRTRQNTKNMNKQKGGADPKLGEKRVAFEEPANDTDVEPEGPKKRKSRGAKKQKVPVAPNMENVNERSTNSGNAPQTAQGNIGNVSTTQPQPDKVNQGPSEKVRERPRPRPAYKQATTTGQTVTTGQISAVPGPSTLQVPGPSVLQDGEIDAFYGSPYEFQDLPGGGYIEVHSDDEHLSPTGPVLNHVAWGNAAYANIGRYSGNSASDDIFN